VRISDAERLRILQGIDPRIAELPAGIAGAWAAIHSRGLSSRINAQDWYAYQTEAADLHKRRELLRHHKGILQAAALARFDARREVEGHGAAWRELNAFARGVQRMVIDRRADLIAARIEHADRLDASLSDDSVKRWARRRAGECGAVMFRAGDSLSERYCAGRNYASSFGIDAPELKEDATEDETAPAVARLACRRWWLRRARRKVDRDLEAEEISAGRVRRSAGVYVSDANMRRGEAQARRNRQLLLDLQAVNELGEAFTLADLQESSLANPHIRRCELMVRLKGCEALADRVGYVGRFLTWTLPSRYHAQPSNMSDRNPAWIAAGEPSPREGQMVLRDLWAKARASLAKMHARYFGVRVAEPHADATPHWHLLLFIAADQADAVCDLLRRYAMADSPEEPGADKHRFKVEVIDKAKGSATAYVAKYVAKMTTGKGLDAARSRDADGEQREVGTPWESAQRARRWASVHGIRQFQFVGTPPIGIWRECRRLEGPVPREFNGRPLTARTWSAMENARQAADGVPVERIAEDGSVEVVKVPDYAAHVRALGGVHIKRDDLRVRVWRQADGTLGAYGDLAAPATRGVAAVQSLRVPVGVRRSHVRRRERNGRAVVSCRLSTVYAPSRVNVAEVLTRLHVWTIKPREDAPQRAAGETAPWTRVNNCNRAGEGDAAPSTIHAAGDAVLPAESPPVTVIDRDPAPSDPPMQASTPTESPQARWLREFGTAKHRIKAAAADRLRADPAACDRVLSLFARRERQGEKPK
jgi:hypothetical protein